MDLAQKWNPLTTCITASNNRDRGTNTTEWSLFLTPRTNKFACIWRSNTTAQPTYTSVCVPSRLTWQTSPLPVPSNSLDPITISSSIYSCECTFFFNIPWVNGKKVDLFAFMQVSALEPFSSLEWKRQSWWWVMWSYSQHPFAHWESADSITSPPWGSLFLCTCDVKVFMKLIWSLYH